MQPDQAKSEPKETGIDAPQGFGGPLGGRVALVTGAAGGIGAAICDELERLGARVVRVDRDDPHCLSFDLASEEASRAMVAEVLSSNERLDIIVLNAGLQFMAPIPEFPTAQWDALNNIMVRSPFLVIREAWAALAESPAGRIVAVGSRSSFLGSAHKAAYVAAKHALLGLIRVAAIEGAETGIAATLLAPGWVDTPLLRRQLPDQARLLGVSQSEAVEILRSQTPRGRFLRPEEVARVAGFLAGDAAAVLSGTIVEVN